MKFNVYVMLGVIGYLTIITIVSTSLEISLNSELGQMISTDSAGITVSFFRSCLNTLLTVLTFSIPSVPMVWYFFLFYPAMFLFIFALLDTIKKLVFSPVI